jgi:hypothetical protein
MHATIKALRLLGTLTSSRIVDLSSCAHPPPSPFPAVSSSISRSIFCTSPRTMLWLSSPYILASTCVAFSRCPALTSHRGVSGIPRSDTNCNTAGTAPKPTIHLHPCGISENSQPTTYATTCPPVMNSTLTVTKRPRQPAGLVSAIYSGVRPLAAPIPSPTMARPSTMTGTVPATASMRAPATKSTSERRMTGLRPSASASRPERGDATRAPTDVMEVIRLLSSVDNGALERSLWIETRVDDMTPVLKPVSPSCRITA